VCGFGSTVLLPFLGILGDMDDLLGVQDGYSGVREQRSNHAYISVWAHQAFLVRQSVSHFSAAWLKGISSSTAQFLWCD
jgi:hypothetical protein